jgi:hypothetical protein
MGRIVVLLVAITIAVAGCSGSTGGEAGSRLPQTTDSQFTDRTADAYATIIRRLVHGSPVGALGAVFVLDGAVEDSGSPLYRFDEAREPFPAAVKRRIAQALSDLPPLAFVGSLESILGVDGRYGPGILIGLGPISEADGAVTFFDCADGRLIVYPIGVS